MDELETLNELCSQRKEEIRKLKEEVRALREEVTKLRNVRSWGDYTGAAS